MPPIMKTRCIIWRALSSLPCARAAPTSAEIEKLRLIGKICMIVSTEYVIAIAT